MAVSSLRWLVPIEERDMEYSRSVVGRRIWGVRNLNCGRRSVVDDAVTVDGGKNAERIRDARLSVAGNASVKL